MKARKRFFSIAVALVLLAGCAAVQGGGLFRHDQSGNTRQAQLTERIRLLDIDWAIIKKDAPPLPDTVQFRARLGEATQAVAAGKLDEGEKALADAEAWMAQARPRYYREHEAEVVTGSSKETSDQLMASALALMQQGLTAKQAGDMAGAQKYLEAAVEEGELAIAASGRTLQKPDALTRLVEQMATIYTADGHPEKIAELHNRVVTLLQAGIDATDRQIQQRLKGTAPDFDDASLKKDKAATDKVIKGLELLYDQYRRQVESANIFAPGEIKSNEYGLNIANWKAWWQKYWEPPKPVPGPHEHEQNPDTQKACADALIVQNQMKKGAASIQGSGIVLEETEVYTYGNLVVIRGKVQNLRNEPIFNPRITVTGRVMSKVVDLSYDQMNPPQSTTFMVALECYPADTYFRAKNWVPDHEILLIFKEPNGTERKLILPVKGHSGN